MTERATIEKEYMKKKPRRRTKNILKDIFFQKQEIQHLALTTYHLNSKKAEGVTIITFADKIISQRIDAKKMAWIDSLEQWVLSNYSLRSFDEKGVENKIVISTNDTLLSLPLHPNEISRWK